MKKAVRIPLSIAALGALTAGAYGYDLSMSADEWRIIGSSQGISISSIVPDYGECGTSPIISAWRYEDDAWTVKNCKYDAQTELGYETVADTGSYEGIWIHASDDPKLVASVTETGTDDFLMETTAGWNLMSVGDEAIVFEEDEKYTIFQDKSNGVIVFRYISDTASWEVYSPSELEEADYVEATYIDANEGFWVYVNSDKSYAVADPDAETLDVDDTIQTDPITSGDLDVAAEDNPANNMSLVISFPSTTDRYYSYDFELGDTDIEDTASDLKSLSTSLLTAITKGSTTSAADSQGILEYINSTSTEVAPVTYDTYDTDEDDYHKGVFWELYNQIVTSSFTPAELQEKASELYTQISEINASLAQLSSADLSSNFIATVGEDNQTAHYYLYNVLYGINTDGNATHYAAAYSSGSETAPTAAWLVKYQDDEDYESVIETAENKALLYLSNVKENIAAAETIFTTQSSKAASLKSTASDLYDLIVAEMESATDGRIVWTVDTVAESNITEIPQVTTVTVSTGLTGANEATDGSDASVKDNEEVMLITITGDNIADATVTYISLHNDANSTIWADGELNATIGYLDSTGSVQTGSIYNEVYISGVEYNGTQIKEFNITGAEDTGAFNVAISTFDHDGSDVTVAGDLVFGVDINVTDAVTYIAENDVQMQTGHFELFGSFKTGDEINISVDNGMTSQYVEDGYDTTFTMTAAGFFDGVGDGNYSYSVRSTDIGSTDSDTRTNIAEKLVTLFDDDDNLTVTSSASVVTITTAPASDYEDNETVKTAVYDFSTMLNGIDYETIEARAETAVSVAAEVNTRIKEFLREEGTTLYSLKDIANQAYDALFSFTTDEPITEINVYQDDYARLYWNMEGNDATTATAAASECSSSVENRIDAWRLPTMLEVVSIYDSNSSEVNEVFQEADTPNVFSSSTNYILTGDMDSDGDYYALKLSDMTVKMITATETLSSTVKTTCVADYYDVGESEYKFNDYYYYTDAEQTTDRLYKSGGAVYDRVLNLKYTVVGGGSEVAQGLVGSNGTDDWTVANSVCTSSSLTLISADVLRSLAMYDLHAVFNDDQAAGGLNRSGLFDGSMDEDDSFWTSTAGTGSDATEGYYTIMPTADFDYTNLFDTVYPETGGSVTHKVICVESY